MHYFGISTPRLGRSCKRSCNCVQLLVQLQLLSTIANAKPYHLTTATASTTATHIKPTIASATANDGFQPGTTAITTAIAAHMSSATASTIEILGQAQLQSQLQLKGYS